MGNLGKIVSRVSLGVFFCLSSQAKDVYEINSRNTELYATVVSKISEDHYLKPTTDNAFYLASILSYAAALDTYKIIFDIDTLTNLVKSLPSEGVDTQLEADIIYQVYNLYIQGLEEQIRSLPALRPTQPLVSHLQDDLAANAFELQQRRNNFVYERYLRAKLYKAPAQSVPTAIAHLLRVEISQTKVRKLSEPLSIYFNALGSLLDPNTFFENSDETILEGSGLMGVTFAQGNGVINIQHVSPNSAADVAGVKAGDIWLGYEHTPNSGFLYSSVVNLKEFGDIVSGDADQTSNLLLKRNGKSLVLAVTRRHKDEPKLSSNHLETQSQQPSISPALIRVDGETPKVEAFLPENKSVKLYFIKGNTTDLLYPMILLPTFSHNMDFNEAPISKQVENALVAIRKMKEENSRIQNKLILDLRNNGGGLTVEAVNSAQLFLQDRVSVPVIFTNGKLDAQRSQDHVLPKHRFGDVVIWTNEFCASSCEMFTSIMQDTGRALIVGSQRTFGKGVGQTVSPIMITPQYDLFDDDILGDSFLDKMFKFPDVNKMIEELEKKQSELESEEEEIEPILAGRLGVTTFSYYRLTGESLQGGGLRPDVILPSGNEFSDIGMNHKRNHIVAGRTAAAEGIHLKYLDAQMVANLNRASVRRWLTDPYFNYTKQLQKFASVNKDKASVSLSLEARRQFDSKVSAALAKVKTEEDKLNALTYEFQLYNEKEKAVGGKTFQAPMQEFMRVSLDYFYR